MAGKGRLRHLSFSALVVLYQLLPYSSCHCSFTCVICILLEKGLSEKSIQVTVEDVTRKQVSRSIRVIITIITKKAESNLIITTLQDSTVLENTFQQAVPEAVITEPPVVTLTELAVPGWYSCSRACVSLCILVSVAFLVSFH